MSEETRKNLSSAATGRIFTDEVRNKISEARKGIKLSDDIRDKISVSTIALIGIAVTVKNINTNEVLEFASLTDAAEFIGVNRTAVKKITWYWKINKKTIYTGHKKYLKKYFIIC